MDTRKIFVVILVAVTISLSSLSYYFYQVIYSPNILVDEEPRFIDIPTGSTFPDVQDIIHQGKYAGDMLSFSFLSKLLKYDKHIKPGRYLFKSNMSNREAINLLRSGNQTPVRLTFNNIRTLEELPEKVCRDIEMKPSELSVFISDPGIYEKYGFAEENFISMFIPNTYEVYWDITPAQLLERMKREYDVFWNTNRQEKAKNLKLSPVEISVLASIVKAECSRTEEAPVIAGLYLNRLVKNMPLQADPTVVFANRDFSIRRVLTKHKEIDSPYNTYKYLGLPPGPINMPDIIYIDAVLNYSRHDFIYMCAKEDFSGYHYFTRSYSEHLSYARKYAQALNREKIYR